MSIKINGTLYFSAADVAGDLGIVRQTLWRWRKSGKVPGGSRYRDRQVLFTSEEMRAIREFAHRIESLDRQASRSLDSRASMRGRAPR